jgi:magnesium-transporting ATPase (P-type)
MVCNIIVDMCIITLLMNHVVLTECFVLMEQQVCFFFYKNIVFGVTLFLYECYTSFSGQTFYNDWSMSLYNVLFTSLPVIAMGVFDQDVSARFCLKVRTYIINFRN